MGNYANESSIVPESFKRYDYPAKKINFSSELVNLLGLLK